MDSTLFFSIDSRLCIGERALKSGNIGLAFHLQRRSTTAAYQYIFEIGSCIFQGIVLLQPHVSGSVSGKSQLHLAVITEHGVFNRAHTAMEVSADGAVVFAEHAEEG